MTIEETFDPLTWHDKKARLCNFLGNCGRSRRRRGHGFAWVPMSQVLIALLFVNWIWFNSCWKFLFLSTLSIPTFPGFKHHRFCWRDVSAVLFFQVPYIISAGDLHHPSCKEKFRNVFTKLHVFNPEVLPFHKAEWNLNGLAKIGWRIWLDRIFQGFLTLDVIWCRWCSWTWTWLFCGTLKTTVFPPVCSRNQFWGETSTNFSSFEHLRVWAPSATLMGRFRRWMRWLRSEMKSKSERDAIQMNFVHDT